MKLILTLIPVLIAAAAVVHADTTNAPAPIKIGTAEANKHFDEAAVVTGKVAQVTFRPKLVFLNLDQPFPDSPFSAVIFAKDTNHFGDLKALNGKSVEISGTIKKFKDLPEIVIETTNQLQIIGPKPADGGKLSH